MPEPDNEGNLDDIPLPSDVTDSQADAISPDDPTPDMDAASAAPPGGIHIHVGGNNNDDDDDEEAPRKRWSFSQTLIVTILGPMAMVVVTAWANHRFNVNQEKAEETTEKVGDVAETAKELKTLLNEVRVREIKNREESALRMMTMGQMVVELRNVLNTALTQMAISRAASEIRERNLGWRMPGASPDRAEFARAHYDEIVEQAVVQMAGPGVDADVVRAKVGMAMETYVDRLEAAEVALQPGMEDGPEEAMPEDAPPEDMPPIDEAPLDRMDELERELERGAGMR